LEGLEYCALAWGDFDNDGDLDLAASGVDVTFSQIGRIYRNDGSGTFTDIGAPLIGVSSCSIAWGDYDRDGDLDLAISGYNFTLDRISIVYRNDGSGVFTDIGAALTGVMYCGIAWGDCDGDGDLDLAIAGLSTSGYSTQIYRNDGAGVFTDIGAPLDGVGFSSVAWGDFDVDGDLDLAIAGISSGPYVTKVYRNDGGGVFTDIGAPLVGTAWSSVAWADCDNDGDLDLASAGYDGSMAITQIYRNDGGSAFTDLSAPLTGVSQGDGGHSLAWGDHDNDGDLDLAISGLNLSSGPVSRIYQVNLDTINASPASPTALSATPGATSVSLTWSAPTDDLTPAVGLSYDLRIGTAPGGSDTLAPMSDVATGYRRIARAAFLQGPSATVSLPPGTYYWSVQAVDSGLRGSTWGTEGTFTIP
jgi:hypothetical protein